MLDHLSPYDRRLLDEFQRDFPLDPSPFASIGAVVGMDEAEVIARFRALLALGVVARIGATVRPNTAGASTLAAVRAPDDRIDEVAALIGSEPGVNHSYLREDEWNIWFVVTAPDAAELQDALDRIERLSGLRVLDLRLVRAFNIDLGFSLSGKRGVPAGRPLRLAELAANDSPLLQALAEGLPLVPHPYAALALRLGRSEDDVVARISALNEAGIISRLGVIVRHRAVGWTANAMVTWDLPEDRIIRAGEAIAARRGVSLCYQRRTVPGLWPYGLFNMIHARSRHEALGVLEGLKAITELEQARHRVLFSTRCFKQTGALVHRQGMAA